MRQSMGRVYKKSPGVVTATLVSKGYATTSAKSKPTKTGRKSRETDKDEEQKVKKESSPRKRRKDSNSSEEQEKSRRKSSSSKPMTSEQKRSEE